MCIRTWYTTMWSLPWMFSAVDIAACCVARERPLTPYAACKLCQDVLPWFRCKLARAAIGNSLGLCCCRVVGMNNDICGNPDIFLNMDITGLEECGMLQASMCCVGLMMNTPMNKIGNGAAALLRTSYSVYNVLKIPVLDWYNCPFHLFLHSIWNIQSYLL